MNAKPDNENLENARPVAVPVPDAVQPSAAEAAPEPVARKSKFRKVALILGLPLLLAVGGAYFWVTGGRYIETEDAYVQQDRVNVTSLVTGQIDKVAVHENQRVEAGDLLFTLDSSTYRSAVEQDEAAVATARLEVERMKAAYQAAIAARNVAEAALDNARSDQKRQADLARKGISTTATLDQANLAVQQAEGKLATAEQDVLSAKAALAGNPDIPTDEHPAVREAIAKLHEAQIDLRHTQVKAPFDGIVSQTDRLQVGQYVAPSVPVLVLVRTEGSWIEANFKETELTKMKPGQPVTIAIDTYPDHELHGTIDSIGAGTGAEFSLIPAQNATGNWVKVVQRIPVRIDIDDDSVEARLRAGMSTSVTVDTGSVRGLPDFVQHALSAIGVDMPVMASAAVAAEGQAPEK